MLLLWFLLGCDNIKQNLHRFETEVHGVSDTVTGGLYLNDSQTSAKEKNQSYKWINMSILPASLTDSVRNNNFDP